MFLNKYLFIVVQVQLSQLPPPASPAAPPPCLPLSNLPPLAAAFLKSDYILVFVAVAVQ